LLANPRQPARLLLGKPPLLATPPRSLRFLELADGRKLARCK
jgi:hypothetical protein